VVVDTPETVVVVEVDVEQDTRSAKYTVEDVEEDAVEDVAAEMEAVILAADTEEMFIHALQNQLPTTSQ